MIIMFLGAANLVPLFTHIYPFSPVYRQELTAYQKGPQLACDFGAFLVKTPVLYKYS